MTLDKQNTITSHNDRFMKFKATKLPDGIKHSQAYSWRHALLEMLPMYTAITLICRQGNIWIYIAFIPVLLLLLWKFYLSNIFNERIWLQAP